MVIFQGSLKRINQVHAWKYQEVVAEVVETTRGG